MRLVPFRPAVVSTRRRRRSADFLAKHALALGALTCVGCASYEPRPLLPEAELANLRSTTLADLRIEYAESGAPPDREPLRFDASDGLDEAELASIALTINPTLRARRAEIGEASALLVSAGLLPNPELGVSLRPGIGGTAGTNFGLDLLFTLLAPDERPALRAVAEARVEEVRAGIAVEETRIVSEVRRARLAVLSGEQIVRLRQQEADLRDDAVTLIRKQRELGEATEIALALVELERTTARHHLREAQGAVERERSSLIALLGLPPAYDLALVGSGSDLAFTILPDLGDDELDARLLAGRADLRASAAKYQRAEEELRLAVARQYPHLDLGPSYERDTDGKEVLGLGASIELPLFDRNQGEIAEKAAARERLRAEYVAQLHGLRARAYEARAELRRSRAEVELQQREILPLVEHAETLYEAALRAREVSASDWLVARERMLQARGELLGALTRYAAAAVELDSATGAQLVTVVSEAPDDEEPR